MTRCDDPASKNRFFWARIPGPSRGHHHTIKYTTSLCAHAPSCCHAPQRRPVPSSSMSCTRAVSTAPEPASRDCSRLPTTS
jgi:hypothetical protein